MKLVLDTNIYLASLMATSLCYDLTQHVFDLKNGHEVFISDALYVELVRKIGSKKESISGQSLPWLMHQLSEIAKPVKILEKIKAVKADPEDDKVLECAVAADADLIISMDYHLLKLKNFRTVGIVHPETFFHMLPKAK